MQDQQYYTPAIEDLFIGYECEYKELYGDNFKKTTIKDPWDLHMLTDGRVSIDGVIRTPFLTSELIEADGWKIGWYDDRSQMNSSQELLHLSGRNLRGDCMYGCIYNRISHHLLISVQQGRGVAQTIFAGHCPSINEFRKITKLIGIEKPEPVKAV